MQQIGNSERLPGMDKNKLNEKIDAELVELSKSGSAHEAYAELIKRHYDRCFRRAQSILSEPADAEDAVQDALVRALQKIHQLENAQSFGSWLDCIVVSCCISNVRRKHPELRDNKAALDHLSDGDDPEEHAIAKEREEAVIEAINELPEKYRDAVRLFNLNGQSYQSIAKLLDLPMGTVKSLISRARDRLGVLLEPYCFYWTPIHQF